MQIFFIMTVLAGALVSTGLAADFFYMETWKITSAAVALDHHFLDPMTATYGPNNYVYTTKKQYGRWGCAYFVLARLGRSLASLSARNTFSNDWYGTSR
jgi:hypothetical protein